MKWPAPFSPELWDDPFRDGLVRVREAVWARDHRLPEEERAALRAVAGHPAFTGLGPAIDALARGRWIAARTAEAVVRLRRALPPEADTPGGSPADKAVLLWAHALQRGERPDELARRFPDLLPARDERATRAAPGLRVRAVMWLPGNRPRLPSRDGIERIYYAVSAALQATGDGAPAIADVVFDYEWGQLQAGGVDDQRQLLCLLALLAPAPLPLGLLSDGWEALPSPLRRTVRDRTALLEMAETLAARGLVSVAGDAVACGPGVQHQVRGRLEAREERTMCAFAVRFLRAGLPPDTHFSGSWAVWEPAVGHVETAVGHAERLGVRIEDAAHLLDRLAVYHREADYDAEAAIRTSERALALAEGAGQPDPVEYAIYLGNYGMALRMARRMPEAVDAMDRSLEVTRRSVGSEHEEYAGSLNIKGSILEAWKRDAEAGAAHREAVAIIRRVAARRSDPAVTGTLVEILNDYAAHLLRQATGAPDDELLREALALLDEALGHVERGEYGWRQITMNRADALRRAGHLDEAEAMFRDLVRHCEEAYGDPSYELSVALQDLAEILRERGNPEYDAVYLRAHEVDDAVGPDA